MKTAIISPIPCLHLYAGLSDYHLILAHQVNSNPDYAAFYRTRREIGDFVILDNSAHELGEGESEQSLLDAYNKVEPDELVLPDRMFFGEDTYQESRHMRTWLRGKVSTTTRFMGVPQGRTLMEWDACCEGLIRLGVDTIGISKDYEVWPGGLIKRVQVARAAIRNYSCKKVDIHLLGWGRDMRALGIIADKYPDIRGVDSAKPVVFAAHGLSLPSDLYPVPEYPRRLKGYMNLKPADIDLDFARHNIQVFKRWARDGK